MTLLAGCYERFLFGYSYQGAQAGKDSDKAAGLQRAFTHAAHKGVVKCAAAAGQYAATGGADDLIHLYDLKNDKDLGFLMSPGEGAVTALAFFVPPAAYNPTHLLTGSADGSISVWQAGGGWECMKTMRGHKKEVAAISVHPSGLLALSVSRDCCLRMWDLVKGRCTYTVRLEAEAEAVQFCPAEGDRYALLCGTRVTLHGVADEAGVLCTLSHPRRVLCMAWAPGNRLVTGSEDGSLRLWDAQDGTELLCFSRAHTSRIRALALLPTSGNGGEGSSEEQPPLLLATGSSDGSIKLWELTRAAVSAAGSGGGGGSGSSSACLAEVQTRARLTCMAATDPPAVMQQRLQQVRQAAAAAAGAAAAAQPQQQQGKKRKGQAAAGHQQAQQEQDARPAKKAARQQQQAASLQQQQPAAAKSKSGGSGKPGGKQAAAGSAPGSSGRGAAPHDDDDGAVAHDGVVEFPDSPDQQQRKQRKQKEVQRRQAAAAQQGKRFRSMPGQAHARPAPRQQQQQGRRKQAHGKQKQRPAKQQQ